MKLQNNINLITDEDLFRESPLEAGGEAKPERLEDPGQGRPQNPKIRTHRASTTGYMGRRSKMGTTNLQTPLDLHQQRTQYKNNFFPKTSKSGNFNQKGTFEENFNSAARKGLKTRAASRKGFGYFYKSSYQKYYKPPDLQKENPKSKKDEEYSNKKGNLGNSQKDGKKVFTVFELNLRYGEFINSEEVKLWDWYERHWIRFTKKNDNICLLTANQIPLPIDNITFVLHMRRILERKGEMHQTKNTKEQWQKCIKEALRRYHPDKFTQNFGKYLVNEKEKETVIEKINELCQSLTTCFQF